jgi:hypothetical protein
MSNVTILPAPSIYTLQLEAAGVDVILRGLFCLAKHLPTQLDSVVPGSDEAQHLIAVTEMTTALIEYLVELPGITHN